LASAFAASAFQNNAFQIDGVVPPVTTAGRSYGSQYRAKTISRELREKERAARKAGRKLRTRVVAAMQDEPWFQRNQVVALDYVTKEIQTEFVPQFIEDGTGQRLMDAAIAYLIREARARAEWDDDDFLLLSVL
jgi:hypothetical protein